MQRQHTHNNIQILAHSLRALEERLVLMLSGLLVLLSFLYMYFVGGAVVHAVVSKDIQKRNAHAHSEVAELEVVYLSQKNKATERLAEDLGFVVVGKKHFAERRSALGLVSTQDSR